jgi:hypothetical protein
MNLATCIGCGCDDSHACYGGCYWLRLDREEGLGVCSECPEHLEAWDLGDRTTRAEAAASLENPARVPRPERPAPPSVQPNSGICQEISAGATTVRIAPRSGVCPHDWPFQDVRDDDCCRWCGMSFLHHLFAELA